MTGTTTMQRHPMAAVDVTRARAAYVMANVMASELGGNGSWSIPCTPVATFHKPEPRRPQVIHS